MSSSYAVMLYFEISITPSKHTHVYLTYPRGIPLVATIQSSTVHPNLPIQIEKNSIKRLENSLPYPSGQFPSVHPIHFLIVNREKHQYASLKNINPPLSTSLSSWTTIRHDYFHYRFLDFKVCYAVIRGRYLKLLSVNFKIKPISIAKELKQTKRISTF